MQVCPDRDCRSQLRSLFPEATFVGCRDIEVRACVADSRRVEQGDLFVAIAGDSADGHDFAAEAIHRGCSAILSQRPLPEATVPVCIVADSRAAFGRLCHHLAGNPARHLKVIGVTGTNGKTTTSVLIARMFTHAGYRVGLLGTLGYFDGDRCDESTLTTPPADRLADYLARMVRNECNYAVMEVSSHALAQARLAGMELDTVCVTNVRRDHLDYHRTIDDYRLTKSKAFDYLSPEGFAVLNADDPTSAGFLSRVEGPVLSIGVHAAAEITGTLIERYLSEQTFLLTAGSDTIPVRTRMIGMHHVYNCLEAAAVGLTYGLDLTTVVRSLEAVDYVPGRLQRIECGQPFGVFVDYAHTPDALTGCLRALRSVVSGRLICVFGAGGDRDRGKRPLMGRAVEADADLAILTSDNPRSEDPQAILGDVLDGFAHPADALVIADRREAIHAALAAARTGDCVLIAGKGHERCQLIGDESLPFDDYEIAAGWLYENLPTGV
ncbi:MAG TPA: UDP-N-acetylmuramoyl-L-alanyl-D-glutamate--2,6-diaminopimelate ligase [Thermoguttaceae bacterium]|nr:UDP-N-acetylmuramoyl-L-alanyl-D-glutamate--2,6-diaminopimelate ligase [Thermoguttaceae bacterium]